MLQILQRPPQDFTLNKDSPQAKGLTGWWPTRRPNAVSAGSVGIRNLIRGGNHGTFETGDTVLPVYSANEMGVQVLDFQGSGTNRPFITVPAYEGIDPALELGVGAWIFDPSGTDIHSLNRDGSPRIWIIRPNSSTAVNWHVWNSGASLKQLTPANSWVLNEWFHIFCTAKVNGSNIDMEVFFNGISKGTTNFAGTAIQQSGSIALNIGPNPSTVKVQQIFDVRVYSKVPSAQTIFQMWHPATRWDLYKPISPAIIGIPVVAVGVTTRRYSLPLTGVG